MGRNGSLADVKLDAPAPRAGRCFPDRPGVLIPAMPTDPDIDELRRLEQVCLEQAEQCATPEGRAALLSMAADYRAAAERAERPAASGR